MAYDPASTIGQVRLKVIDTAEAVFTDAEISAALSRNDGSIGYAAAELLEARAAVIALAGGKIKILDIDVDASRAADVLIKLAKQYREAEDVDGGISFGQPATTVFAQAEAIRNAFMRSLL